MLKMIIADDEYMVREGLRHIINWQDYGIEIIAEATDGKEAYELCFKLLPDILFTDIRMPFMDGLEVSEKVKEQSKNLKVIIFSGIQDFEYAKSALNINAEGYILKPLDVDELIKVITKVVNKIKSESSMEERVHQLRLQLHENFGAAREKFFRSLALGVYKKEKEILEKLEYFKNPFSIDQLLSVAVLQIDDYNKIMEDYLEEDKQLLSFSVTNIIEELINNYSKGISVLIGENEYLLLFHYKNPTEDEVENEIYSEILLCLKTYMKISVSIGVGRIVDNILNINSAYKDAVNALSFKFYTGKGSIINISDISSDFEKNEFPDLYAEGNELVNSIKSGNVVETKKNIEAIFNNFNHDKKYTIEYAQRICTELIYVTSRAVYELGEDISDIAEKRPAIIDAIYKCECIADLRQIMIELLIKITEHLLRKYRQKNNKLISDIKNLIDRKYMENVSVNMIADTVFRSPNYISLIFKQETGETISDFLTKKRMNEAKVLLKETDFKIFEIAEMIGFQDSSYFSKVFKKHTGIHPQQYRSLGNV